MHSSNYAIKFNTDNHTTVTAFLLKFVTIHVKKSKFTINTAHKKIHFRLWKFYIYILIYTVHTVYFGA